MEPAVFLEEIYRRVETLLRKKQLLLHYISQYRSQLFAIDPSIKLKDEPYHAPIRKS